MLHLVFLNAYDYLTISLLYMPCMVFMALFADAAAVFSAVIS